MDALRTETYEAMTEIMEIILKDRRPQDFSEAAMQSLKDDAENLDAAAWLARVSESGARLSTLFDLMEAIEIPEEENPEGYKARQRTMSLDKPLDRLTAAVRAEFQPLAEQRAKEAGITTEEYMRAAGL